MNADDEVDELLGALRADLPTVEQSARVRTRLVALGVVGAKGLSASAAGAAVGATRFAALSWGTKVGLAAAVSASAIVTPIWLSSAPRPAGSSSVSSQSAASSRTVAAVARSNGPRRLALEPERLPDPETARPSPATRPAPPASAVVSGKLAAPVPALLARIEPRNVEDAALRRGSRVALASAGASRALAPSSGAVSSEPATSSSTAEWNLPVAPATDSSKNPDPARAMLPAPLVTEKPNTTLREETALIDGAFAALRRGELELATLLVDQHERRFPDGLLRRERERAKAWLARGAGASE